jgi:plasmid stabilization system protein ParE
MDDRPEETQRVVLFTEAALLDLAGIDNATAVMWGVAQAERYLAFLDDVFNKLVDLPTLGIIVDQHPEYRSYLAKFNRRKSAHGHRVFYRPIPGGIHVIRILHTAMNWPDHI